MLGYYGCSKGYRVYNTETQIVGESIHVRFDDNLDFKKSKLVEKFVDLEFTYSGSEGKTLEAEAKDSEAPQQEVVEAHTPLRRHRQNISHSEELIMGDKSEPVRTRSSSKPSKETLWGLVSLIEPTSIDEVLLDT